MWDMYFVFQILNLVFFVFFFFRIWYYLPLIFSFLECLYRQSYTFLLAKELFHKTSQLQHCKFTRNLLGLLVHSIHLLNDAGAETK